MNWLPNVPPGNEVGQCVKSPLGGFPWRYQRKTGMRLATESYVSRKEAGPTHEGPPCLLKILESTLKS